MFHFRKKRSAELLNSSIFLDICIQVEDTKFECHRFVLACASEFFEKLFVNDGAETGKVRLGDTTPQVFEIILNVIYTESDEPLQNLDYAKLLDVLICANMWLIHEVEDLCTELLKKRVVGADPDVLIEYFEVFYLLNNEEFLSIIIKVHLNYLPLYTLNVNDFHTFVSNKVLRE